MYRKKTKIVATIGPASESEEILTKMMEAGLDVLRFNFSHGDLAEHEERAKRARAIALKLGKPIAVLQDLGGPKIRLGEFTAGTIDLKAGQDFTLTTREVLGDENIVSVNYPPLPKEVEAGMVIFLDDGKKKLIVEKIEDEDVKCRVEVGGPIKGRRGVNIPDAHLSISSLTDKDRADLEFAFKNEADFVALSFVRRASDIKDLRQLLDARDKRIKIIAKIETKEAINNLDEIVAAADGIMVARGDLAIEVPAEDVPIIQKDLIKRCNAVGKPVITATQMLESMINSPVPTRAEVNDVANAIFDGTDAVMLSGETTLGEYPVEVVQTMNRIAIRSEGHIEHADILESSHLVAKDVTDSISYAALNTAHEVGAEAIVALSNTGFTARMISRHRPHRPVIVFTPDLKVYQQLALSFGCYPMVVEEQFTSVNEAIERSEKAIKEAGLVNQGDKIVIVAGVPFGRSGNTNLLIVETI